MNTYKKSFITGALAVLCLIAPQQTKASFVLPCLGVIACEVAKTVLQQQASEIGSSLLEKVPFLQKHTIAQKILSPLVMFIYNKTLGSRVDTKLSNMGQRIQDLIAGRPFVEKPQQTHPINKAGQHARSALLVATAIKSIPMPFLKWSTLSITDSIVAGSLLYGGYCGCSWLVRKYGPKALSLITKKFARTSAPTETKKHVHHAFSGSEEHEHIL